MLVILRAAIIRTDSRVSQTTTHALTCSSARSLHCTHLINLDEGETPSSWFAVQMDDIESRPRGRYGGATGRTPRATQAAHTEEGANGGRGAPVEIAVAESPLAAIGEEVAVLAPVAPVAEGPPVKHLSPLGAVVQLAAGGATVRPLGTRQGGGGALP